LILIDANLLLYAYNTSAERHIPAKQWLEKIFSGSQPVAIPWMVLLAFVRISTNPRAFPSPLTAVEAVEVVSQWLEQPVVVLLETGGQHWTSLSKLLVTAQVNGPLVMDAHLAALAMDHGATLYTTDQDFRRFPSLKFQNPLDK